MGIFSFLRTVHYRVLAVLWTVGIVVVCSMPAETLPQMRSVFSPDKAVHGILFVGFGILWMRGLCPPGDGSLASCFLRRGVVLFLGGCVFAVATELYQHLAPLRRRADPYDALSNILGLLLAFGVYFVYHEYVSDGDAT